MRAAWISISALAASFALGAAAPAGAATMLDVNWNSGCGKSNCFNDKGQFSQTWTSAGATGPMTISQFLLDRGILGDLDGKTFTISFTIGGKDVGSWGHFNMGAIAGDELTFSGQDFVWNPEDGDLVLTLQIDKPAVGGAGGGGGNFFSSPSEDTANDPPKSNPPPPTGTFPSDETDGSFGGTELPINPGAVPEPAAWALMISGFGFAGAALRRRRALAA